MLSFAEGLAEVSLASTPVEDSMPATADVGEDATITWVDLDACPVCGSTEARPFHRFADSIEHGFARCPVCDVAYLASRPVYNEAYLRAFYDIKGPFSLPDDDCNRKVINRCLDLMEGVERLVPSKGELLDVGCAFGYLLSVARDRGWSVHGIELYESCLATCRKSGFDVHAEDVMATPASRRFDVVTACHVLEHTPDPVGFLRALRDRLRDGGLMAVEVPNIDGHDEWVKRWLAVRGLRKPRVTGSAHLCEFSHRALVNAAGRAGLTPVACHTYGHSDSRGWVARVRAAVFRRFLLGSKLRIFLIRTAG
jgi:SAM-dependent methyltransferase